VDSISFPIAGYTTLNDLATAFHAAHGSKWWIQTFDVGIVRKGYTATQLPALANGLIDYTGLGPPSTLATFTNQPCSSVYTILQDKTPYFNAVVGTNLQSIRTQLDIECNTLIYPGHYASATGEFDLDFEALGVLGIGGGGSGGALPARQEMTPLGGTRIFNTLRTNMDDNMSGTESQVRAKWAGLCQRVIAGARLCLYGHNGYFLGQAAWAADVVRESGVKIELYDNQVRRIRADWVRSTPAGVPTYSQPVIDYTKDQIAAIKGHKVSSAFQGKGAGNARGILRDIQGRARSTVPAIGPIER
jgi:hypothetical protein